MVYNHCRYYLKGRKVLSKRPSVEEIVIKEKIATTSEKEAMTKEILTRINKHNRFVVLEQNIAYLHQSNWYISEMSDPHTISKLKQQKNEIRNTKYCS